MKNNFRGIPAFRRALPLLAVLFLPALAGAHPGLPGHMHGFVTGLAHPLTGADHICAMVAAGLWAAQRGGRSLWAVPLSFVSVMAVGGMLGLAGVGLPFVETGIAVSVLILGVLIAANIRLPLRASVFLMGLFALFHGYAHGAEMPADDSGLLCALGFIMATASLHLGGMGLGLTAKRWNSMRLIRCAGVVVATFGFYLCMAP